MLKVTKERVQLPVNVLKKVKLAIIRSEFNGQLTKSLENHCVKVLAENGLLKGQIFIYQVPGSLEIPLVAQNLARKRIFSAIIALGVVIKGETGHFDVVVNGCARGCMDVSLKYNIPVIFEVIPAYTLEQAQERAGNTINNKGREAAVAALKMIKVMSLV